MIGSGVRPTVDLVVSVAYASGYTVAWLTFGRGPKLARGDIPGLYQGDAEHTLDPKTASGVPVVGLAECGLKGWFRHETQAVTAGRPSDFLDPDGFAVIAIGESMVPAGIANGFLCYCAPAVGPGVGDAVYIERFEGTCSIKRFRRWDAQWLTAEGWLDEQGGRRELYTEQIASSSLKRIAPVIYIKRKL